MTALVGVGVLTTVGWLAVDRRTASPAVPVVNRGTLASSPPQAGRRAPAARTVAHAATPDADAKLVLDRLGVDARIVPVSAPHSVMQIPSDPQVVGWWRDGATPGSGRGHVVIVGHINFYGRAGALAELPDVRPGDPVVVSDARTVRYRVTAVRTYPKTSGIPAAAFSPDGPEELVLITCGGPFNAHTGNYEDNIVAYADPA
ncbi:MAG: class F sortase [Jatrophihabitans sp.]|uniref:class F sortase n=1 Tax=Jatrophihabitans sp. TaxID=1932789 RepID=UPI0039154B83